MMKRYDADVVAAVVDRFYREGQENRRLKGKVSDLALVVADWVQALKATLTADEWKQAVIQGADLTDYIVGILDSSVARDVRYFKNHRIRN